VNYTVVWIPEAEAEVTRLWAVERGRSDIALAVDAMDVMLGRTPVDVGESRDGNRRILFVWPLGVSYVVKESDRIVQVNKVWRYASDRS
jgi:hypothetical protein